MTNSAVLLDRGIRCLNNELGILDAERFVALILRESFDYTEWRKNNLFIGMSIDEIIEEADKYCKENALQPTGGLAQAGWNIPTESAPKN
jgi:hypothetical protein